MRHRAAPERATGNRVPPTGDELRQALKVYAHPDGGWLCPCCGSLLRVLDAFPAQIAGCVDGHALTQLARQAADLGYLHRDAAA